MSAIQQPTAGSKPIIRNRDLLALKAYIQAKDATQYDDVHKNTVVLDLTHSNLVQRHVEVRFNLHDALSTLQQRIHQKTGTPPGHQHLQIKSSGNVIVEIPPEHDDSCKLGYFGLQHGMEVHCVDLNPHSASSGGQYEDTSLVQKFRLSDDEYNKRSGTLRDWGRKKKQEDPTFTLARHAKEHREMVDAKRQHKLGLPLPKGFHVDAKGELARSDDDRGIDSGAMSSASSPSVTADSEEFGETSVAEIRLEQRCEVQPGSRRGTVAYVGKVPELGVGGHWVGVRFDEPVGKTDGTVKGRRYFEAMDKHAGFVRGKNVQVGNFPERDIFEDDSDDDEL